MDYSALNKMESQDLTVESGGIIKAKIVVEKGSLSVKIQKDKEEPVDESGIYTVTVTGKKAKGSVSFTVTVVKNFSII